MTSQANRIAVAKATADGLNEILMDLFTKQTADEPTFEEAMLAISASIQMAQVYATLATIPDKE